MYSSSLDQKTRLFIFLAYVGALFWVSDIALGSWLPPLTKKGLWFYSGLFALLLGGLIEAPFFTRPKGALSFSAFALLPLLGLGLWNQLPEATPEFLSWVGPTIYVSAVLLAALVAMVGHEAKWEWLSRLGDAGYATVQVLGGPRTIFSMVFVFALFNFHVDLLSESHQELLWIGLAWPAIVIGQPLERSASLLSKYKDILLHGLDSDQVGEVIGHGVPGIVTLKHPSSTSIDTGELLLVPGDDQKANIALALDQVGVSDQLWLRALQLDLPEEIRGRLPGGLVGNGGCALLREGKLYREIEALSDAALQDRGNLLGLVAPGTDIETLRFEIVRTDRELEEGRLLRVQVGDRRVLYQIVNGMTKEEIVQQKNTRGFAEGVAKKIGFWDEEERHFVPVPWLPEPNQPVFLIQEEEAEARREAVGYFPRTSYPVSVDVHDLVTHNGAILGILGIGKSFLALELVERLLDEDIKVICLDLTDQYQAELAPHINDGTMEDYVRRLEESAEGGREAYEMNQEEGGSVGDFSTEMEEIIDEFLDEENDEKLLVLDPTAFEVWEQTGGLRPSGEASMGTLTPAKIARITAEAALKAAQESGRTDSAQCCLVFEEAHSLIPEFTAIADEGDKEATNGTARAILQGRKYGLGCLVVSQRTASVTKTVLNQCNTIFAMRVYDATGMKFLANYIGEEYASALSQLDDRNVIVSGKASSCREAVQMRVNEREDFLRLFRGEGE